MTEAEAFTYGFSQWTEVERNERVRRLSELVEQHIRFGLACDLKWSDWHIIARRAEKNMVKKIARLSKSPYMASLHFFVGGVATKCRELGISTNEVKIVLADKGKVFQREWSAIMRLVNAYGFPTPSFEPAAKLAPLQACDMLAWCIYQCCSRPKRYRPVPVRHAPLFKRLFVLRIDDNALHAPMVQLTGRTLTPEEAAKARPIGRLTADSIIDLRLDNEDA